MLKREGFEYGSEGQNYSNKDSILDQVEDMQETHMKENESSDRSQDKGTDQAPPEMNNDILAYGNLLDETDLNDPNQQEKIDKLHQMQEEFAMKYPEYPNETEALKQSFMDKKIGHVDGEIEIV